MVCPGVWKEPPFASMTGGHLDQLGDSQLTPPKDSEVVGGSGGALDGITIS